MRWLIASSQHHPSHGGIGTYVSRFVAAGVQAGWQMELITRPSDLQPHGAVIHAITTPDMQPDFQSRLAALRRIDRVRPYRYALWSLAVARHLNNIRSQFDAVEFVDCQAEGFASLTSERVRSRFSNSKLVVHAHTPMFVEESVNGADPFRFGRSIYHGWERQAIAAADGVIATSRLLARQLPAMQQPCVIPYPIESSSATRSPAEREEHILLIGSVQPRKGVDVWARSLNRVLRERPKARAFLIGPDTPTAPDGLSMAAHVQRLIDPRFIERFRWLGSLPHEQVMDHIRRASLVVVPSIFESFSFVAAEALVHGTPIVVSDQVGIIEHIDGLPTVPAGDADALATAQIAALKDQPTSLQQAHCCRQELLQACSTSRHLNRRIAFLDSLQPAARSGSAETDGIGTLESFIDEVEAAEQSSEVVSSDVS